MQKADREDILSRLTPHDIYGNALSKSSSGYRMLCPFHTEKVPSFYISGERLTFHCFGCGAKGSAFDFIMKREGVEFPESVRILADKAGIDAQAENERQEDFARIFELNNAAASFYQESLTKNNRAMDYLLNKRGFLPESIEKFRVGYIDSKSVVPSLKGRGFSDDEIITSGLGRRKDGKLRDHFWDRIIFPIMQKGKIVAFGGRTLGGGEPKYLNSPATPVFQKKRVLYGLDMSEIKNAGHAIIVEGYTDVITCHQYGYGNAVSPLGTALGEDHIKLLRKYCDTIYTVFDGDAAGRRAAEMASKLCFERRVRGGVVLLPEGEDPDSFLRKGSRLDDLILDAHPFSVFLAKQSPKSRKMVLNMLLSRGPAETATFLSCMSTQEEITSFMEISARALMQDLLRKAKVILRKDRIEVRKYANYLILFSGKQFLLWEKSGEEIRKQAEAMRNRALNLRRHIQQ